MTSFASSPQEQPVLCPRCQRPMMRGAATPIMFTSGLSSVIYSCEPCNTEIVRTVKSDGSRHSAGAIGEKG
jgi:RNase P subunit RPR2